MKKHWKNLPHRKIVYDMRVCRDVDTRSFEQVQGHWKKKCKIFAQSLSFLWRNIESFSLHKDCFLPDGV